jgi:hypothetical protein
MMRLLVRIGVGLLLVLILITGGAWYWYERESRGPAIAEGVGWSRDCCDVDSAYDARLRRVFPVGSSEQHLRDVLVREGFKFQGQRTAVATWWDLACSHFADVEWQVDEGGASSVGKRGRWKFLSLKTWLRPPDPLYPRPTHR